MQLQETPDTSLLKGVLNRYKFLNLSQNAKRVRQSVYRTPLDGLLESVGMAPLTFGYSYAAA